MGPISIKTRPRARRSHPKSRLGCLSCKRRRIKCDEQKPICSTCHFRSTSCAYPTPQVRDGRKPQSPTSTKPSTKPSTTNTRELGAIFCEAPVRPGISLADLDLFHHFATSTYRTLANEVGGSSIWQHHVLKWSMTFPFMLRLVLALSALHLSHESPSKSQHYQTQADDHFAFGLPPVVSIVSSLDITNCQRAYISAVMVCFIYLARGPRPGQYLVFSDKGRSEWWLLVQGIQLILGSYREHVFTGTLATTRTEGRRVPRLDKSVGLELWEHKNHIRSLRQLINHSVADPAHRESYGLALEALVHYFDEVHLERLRQDESPAFVHTIIELMFQLPEDFVILVEKKEPVALVILAHCTIVLEYMSSVWYMRGWSKHILARIRNGLPKNMQHWIEWPVTFMGLDRNELCR
ncbi:putative C6 finger domain protein [Aspergillus sclerotiicarbonarius CBS 121057]|uniref:Putative C6 finger domain protein n=1 Tax=Aspergillus sclerotiicarbonarius (strain CBS 121057 / IBT 28362) TaxID=1448318 RepID=A0A319F9L0_ASPSB|nr:putative C6 finger domain protein [Aspergillus sclerotiicarbonarius CBS 121057]